jgi:cytochrome c peroxidase
MRPSRCPRRRRCPRVPDSLPKPALPEFVTAEAVALGELLFWDTRLSIDNKLACATCHDPAHGYAGAKRQNTATGKPNLRRAPTLVNLAWHKELGWDGATPRSPSTCPRTSSGRWAAISMRW